MKILITGAGGFIGRNLVSTLENIRDGKDRCFASLAAQGLEIFRYDIDTDPALLDGYCKDADFVFHLAGVNRPKEQSEFMQGNFGFTSTLLELLEQHHNTCPLMLSSSTQAELDNPYGQSKRAGEAAVRAFGERTGAKTLIYRFPNVFGKWCRPNYNSAVATFCHNIARDLPITVNNPATQLQLVYIDDVVQELLAALEGHENRVGDFCTVPMVHCATLGRITQLLYEFHDSRKTLSVPDVSDPFVNKLYATYLSYLPPEQLSYPLKKNEDERGSFTEILRTAHHGQFSVNVSRPGITKGNHWHHTKNEKFLVVSGKGVIRFRRPGSEEVYSYYVSGEKPTVVDIPTGYTHSIENLGQENLITFMWANECFNPDRADTYFLPVDPDQAD